MMREPNIYIGRSVRNDLPEKCSVKYENGTGRWVFLLLICYLKVVLA